MSQPTQPHRAPTHTHSPIDQPYNGQAPFPPSPASLQVARGKIYSQQTSRPQRMSEDLFLNIVLYIGSLLLIGAAALFITSVTSSTDETALIRVGLGGRCLLQRGTADLPLREASAHRFLFLYRDWLGFHPPHGYCHIYPRYLESGPFHLAYHFSGRYRRNYWSMYPDA